MLFKTGQRYYDLWNFSAQRPLRPFFASRVIFLGVQYFNAPGDFLYFPHEIVFYHRYTGFITRQSAQRDQRFIAHLGKGTIGHLKDNYRPGQSVTILTGPEGDFSDEEILLAQYHGFRGVTLGQSRLRTETAGIVACHTIQLLNS
jgi:hypothetical protein